MLLSRFHLPGVFAGHPTDVVNGSLWTLPNEARLYLLLMVAWLVGLLAPRRYTALWALVMLAGYALAWRYWPLPDHIQKYAEWHRLSKTGALLWIQTGPGGFPCPGGTVGGLLACFRGCCAATAWAHLPYFSACWTYGPPCTSDAGVKNWARRFVPTTCPMGLTLDRLAAQKSSPWMCRRGKSSAGQIVIQQA